MGRLVLPDWAMNITPLYFVSQPEPFKDYVINFTPLIVMTAIAAVLTAAGVIAYTKRGKVT